MDSASFDRFARLLGGAVTRRAGIGVAAAAVLGRPAAALARPGSSSQCGKRRTSACRRDSDCCNGRCDTSKGKTNVDGLGRCRCARRNEQCGDNRDCCSRKKQGMVCLGGICTAPCAANGTTCDQTTVCCSGTCGGVVGVDRGFASQCCVLPGKSCAADADCCGAPGYACEQGVCAIACMPLGAACTQQDVCCAGACGGVDILTRLPARCCIANGALGCTSSADCCNTLDSCAGNICVTDM